VTLRIGILPAIALLAVVGCGPRTPTAAPGAADPAVPAAPTTAGIESVPQALRHDAFHFYGLTRTQPLQLEQRVEGAETADTGGQTIRFDGVEGDVARFTIERTGDLSRMGSNEAELRADGLYVVSSSIGEIEEPWLELPADLSVGRTWTTRSRMALHGGQKMDVTTTNRVARIERVETGAGAYEEARLVVSEGKGTLDGNSITMTSRSWYVRDRGPVRMELTTTVGAQRGDTMIIQETAPATQEAPR
jgi:hypothetical protein